PVDHVDSSATGGWGLRFDKSLRASRPFSRWNPSGLRSEGEERKAAALAATPGFLGGAALGRHRECRISVLVGRQPLDRVCTGLEAQKNRYSWRPTNRSHGITGSVARRNMELRWRDSDWPQSNAVAYPAPIRIGRSARCSYHWRRRGGGS